MLTGTQRIEAIAYEAHRQNTTYGSLAAKLCGEDLNRIYSAYEGVLRVMREDEKAAKAARRQRKVRKSA